MSSMISGLSSGLDTATIVNQLMQLEAAPQTRLKSRVSSEQSIVTTLQTLNTKVATLRSKAEALAKPAAWTPVTATSSGTGVSVTAGSTASPTSLNVTVTSVARAHQLGFGEAHALTDVVTGASTKVVLDRFDGTPVTLETGDGKLSSLVAAINNPANATGLQASTVKVADGSYKLLVTSAATGAAQDFTLTTEAGGALLGGATVVAGADARLDLGTGITATSTTNTFTDLLPGVTVTLADSTTVGTTSRLSLTRDSAKVSAAVKDLVDGLNGVLTSIDDQSKYDSSTKKAGPLMGEAVARSLRNDLLQSVYDDTGASLADLGITVNRQGTLDFDATKFAEKYAADPTGVAARFTSTADGFAARVGDVAKSGSDPISGTLTAALTGRRSNITTMQNSIDAWDDRLALRRTALEKQFTALETAMNQMQSQSNWLAGQLGSLSSGG